MTRVHIMGSDRLAARLVARLPALVPGVTFTHGLLGEETPGEALAIPVVRLDRVEQLAPWLGRLEHTLGIGLHRGLVYIGPSYRAGYRGCLACLVTRVAGSPHGPDVDTRGRVLVAAPRATDSVDLPALMITPMLLATELGEFLRGDEPRSSSGAIVLDQRTGEVSVQALIPDAWCPICGDAPTRRSPVFAGNGTQLPPCDGVRLRSTDAPALVGAVKDQYHTPHVGFVKELQIDLQSPYGTCYLELPLKGRRAEPCIGRSTTYARAQSVAILEALERYCGWRSGGPREIVTAPYADVADHAVDPTTLGLHPNTCYDLPDYPFVRPTPDLPIDWVWGFSFRRDAPVLVPARYAFYGHGGGKPFLYEVSNGCALGATFEEAVVHGLFELVERDAFLLTWYRKLAVPEISTRDLPERGVRDLLRRVELVTRSTVRLFLSTREHGIPSLFAVATSEREGAPRTLAAGSAHTDLVCATSSVLYELAGLVLRMQTILSERGEDAEAMLDAPRLVRKMEDHALVNCVERARERFSFVLDDATPPITFAEAVRASKLDLPSRTDIGRVLRALVERMMNVDLDVIVVDQTMHELGAVGVHCAKVIVPGMLPMTFGHDHRRTENLPRLRYPYPEARAGIDEIGSLPHPFP